MIEKRKNEKGFVKMNRGIGDWGWYGEPNTRGLFMHLIIFANHAPHEYMGHIIQRGQIVTGLNSLSSKLGISISKLRTAFSNLKSTGEITTITTRRFTVVTLCNYELYNPSREKPDKQNDKQIDNLVASSSQANRNKQEEVEEKKKKKKIIFVVPSRNEVKEYIAHKRYNVDGDYFYDKYENESPPWSNNKGKPITSWKSTLATWNNNANKNKPDQSRGNGVVI